MIVIIMVHHTVHAPGVAVFDVEKKSHRLWSTTYDPLTALVGDYCLPSNICTSSRPWLINSHEGI